MANAMMARSPFIISAGYSALREISLPKAVAEIVLKTGTSAATSTQASQMGQVTGRRRSEGADSVGFIATGFAAIIVLQAGHADRQSCRKFANVALKKPYICIASAGQARADAASEISLNRGGIPPAASREFVRPRALARLRSGRYAASLFAGRSVR